MFRETPFGLAWGLVFSALVLAVCVTDLRSRRIPNVLVVAIAATGFGFSLSTRPLGAALLASGGGLLLGFAIWIVFYVAGVIGAGDVKFFAAAGAWLGPSATWRAALIAGVAGGVLAVFFLLRDRRLGKTLQQMMLAASSGSVAMLGQGVDHQGSRRRGIPYGVALAFGALSAAWLPRLLGGG